GFSVPWGARPCAHRHYSRITHVIRNLAQPPLRTGDVGGDRRRHTADRCLAAGALSAQPCVICAVARRAKRNALLWPGCRITAGRTSRLLQECAVVCLAGTAARAVDSVDPQPRLQR